MEDGKMRIEIVENVREKMKKDNQYVVDVTKGKKVIREKAEKTLVVTPETFSKIFSPERIKLMLKIKNNGFSSIYQLAKALDRKYEAVHRDIKLLEGFGIIRMKTENNSKVPYISEQINIPVFSG